MQTIKIVTLIIIIGAIGWFGFTKKQAQAPTNIDEQEITYSNTSAEYIVVDLPFPGAVTGKEFKVIGRARAFYFEGSFPVDVLDKDGKILVQTYATAQDEWMVDAFVPFEANVKVPDTYIGKATLVLHKDNPSGLPEHDASMSFPFTIEY